MWLVARPRDSKVVSNNTGSNVKNGDMLNLLSTFCLSQGWIIEGKKSGNVEGGKASGNKEDSSSMTDNGIKVSRGWLASDDEVFVGSIRCSTSDD